MAGWKHAKPNKKKQPVRRMLRYDMTADEDEPVEQTSYVLYVDNPRVRKLPPDGVPTKQDEVALIPVDHRGLSFFSSKPALDTALIGIHIPLGSSIRMIHALPDEVESIRDGKMPRVRCFMIEGKLTPWYEWRDYCPYLDYFPAAEDDWIWYDSSIVACSQPVEALSEDIERYLEAESDQTPLVDIVKSRRKNPWRRHQYGLSISRKYPHGDSQRTALKRRLRFVVDPKKPAGGLLDVIRRRLVNIFKRLEALQEPDPFISRHKLDGKRARLQARETRLREILDELVFKELESVPDEPVQRIKAIGKPRKLLHTHEGQSQIVPSQNPVSNFDLYSEETVFADI